MCKSCPTPSLSALVASAPAAKPAPSLAVKREAEHEDRIRAALARIEAAKASIRAAREEAEYDDNKPPVVSHECDKCGQEFHADSEFAVYPARGYRYCSRDCAYDSDWTTCEECDDWVHQDDGLCLENDRGDYVTMCGKTCAENRGFRRCDCCGDWLHENGDDVYRTDDGWNVYCSCDCWENSGYRYCNRCECEYHEDAGCQCSSAADRLHAYHANVFEHAGGGCGSGRAYFRANCYTGKHRLFGFELEVKVDDLNEFLDAAEPTTGNAGRGIWTEDASVDAEYVSLPRPVSVHLQHLRELFDDIEGDCWPHGAGDFKFYNDKGTGFHVHVSRSTLTPVQIGKIDALLNAPAWRGFLERLAGRSANSGYCRFDDDEKGCGLWTAKTAEAGRTRDRYQALNINNPGTIEFRLWRSPKTYTEAAQRLQATEALCEYAAGPVCLRDPADFMAFVLLDRGERWAELKDFCAGYKD